MDNNQINNQNPAVANSNIQNIQTNAQPIQPTQTVQQSQPVQQQPPQATQEIVFQQAQPNNIPPIINSEQQETQNISNMQTQTIENNTTIDNSAIQQQMQAIPTIEQDKQAFMNNSQETAVVKPEEKKSGINITFVVILFIIIFAAIILLFPYLFKSLG